LLHAAILTRRKPGRRPARLLNGPGRWGGASRARTIPAAHPGDPAAPPARPIAGRQIRHEDHGQHIGWRSWALRSGLTLAWLAMLMLLAAAVVIAAYRGSAR